MLRLLASVAVLTFAFTAMLQAQTVKKAEPGSKLVVGDCNHATGDCSIYKPGAQALSEVEKQILDSRRTFTIVAPNGQKYLATPVK